MPSNSLTPELQEELQLLRQEFDEKLQSILEAILEIRDAQLEVQEVVAKAKSGGLWATPPVTSAPETEEQESPGLSSPETPSSPITPQPAPLLSGYYHFTSAFCPEPQPGQGPKSKAKRRRRNRRRKAPQNQDSPAEQPAPQPPPQTNTATSLPCRGLEETSPKQLTDIRIMQPDYMAKLAELAAERDGQRRKGASDEEWRNLMRRARDLFRELSLSVPLSRLLSQTFFVRRISCHNTETAIARVLSKVQCYGYQAGLQELRVLGIPPPKPPMRRS